MTRLVVRRAAAVFGTDHHLALGTEDDPLQRVGEVGLGDDLVIPPRGKQCGLVDEVREVGADHPGCRRRQPTEVDVGPERDAPRVHLEDRLATATVGRLHGDPAVETTGPQQRRVEHLGPVGRADHDDARRSVEAVHLREDLVQRLLALVVPTAEAGDTGRS